MKDVNKPWILGLSTGHNGAAALLHGDDVVVAIQEERLLRMKRAEHPIAWPSLSIRYCLDTACIRPANLSAVAVSGFSLNNPAEDVTLNPFLNTEINHIQVFRVPHHLAHAYGAFYTSGFVDSDVLVVDGHGGTLSTLTAEEVAAIPPSQRCRNAGVSPTDIYETISLYYVNASACLPLEKHISCIADRRLKPGMPYFRTLGKLYAYVGHQIFGDYETGGLDAAGKVMGLAPYGKPAIPVTDFFSIEDGEFVFQDTVPLAFCHRDRWPAHSEEYANLAASAQAAIEVAILSLARRLASLSPNPRLCYAGGVALNSVTNERLIQEAGFSDVFIMPAAEDSGTAVGSAFFALVHSNRTPAPRVLASDSMGRQYTGDDIRRAVSQVPGVQRAESDALSSAADMLAAGKILGWFQGRSELGPRSLGQRSILCDPRNPEMKAILNSRVKFRESFRPYAPVILLEDAVEWLDVAPELADSPFMLRVMHFKEGKKDEVPAVVHVDGTGRIQTVTADRNDRMYRLLRLFRQRTGIPLLLNTSLNTAGDPIAESPEDAIWYLLSTGLDGCVLEDDLITRRPSFESALDFGVSLHIDSILEYRAPQPSHEPTANARGCSFWCLSGPAEIIERLCDTASDYAERYVSFVVPGLYGSVAHVIEAKWRPVLDLMDGRHSGWEILKELREIDALSSERTLYRLLARLRLGSGISLTDLIECPRVSRTSAA